MEFFLKLLYNLYLYFTKFSVDFGDYNLWSEDETEQFLMFKEAQYRKRIENVRQYCSQQVDKDIYLFGSDRTQKPKEC